MSDDEKRDDRKRKAESQDEEKEKEEEESDSDDGEMIGPMPTEAAPIKKPKVLEFEQLYLADLPDSHNYEKSFMHRDVVTFTAVAGNTDFAVTASCDGHVKFWKKTSTTILEFVKHFRAHLGNIQDIALNHNGTLLATVSNDKMAKIFDVINFDMINIIRLGYVPEVACWVHRIGDALPKLAVAEADSTKIHIYDGRSGDAPLLHTAEKLHMKPVVAMAYSPTYDVVISADQGGFVEYWTGNGEPAANVAFKSKLDTDLFEFVKNKTRPLNLTVSPGGKFLAALSADKKVRIFRLRTGKLYRVIDESLKHYFAMHQVKQLNDFNRKVAMEKELEKTDLLKYNNIAFDKSGNFIVFASLAGIKVVNIVTDKVVRVLGRPEHLRFLQVSLYQNLIKQSNTSTTAEMLVSENPGMDEGFTDPTLFCTAFKKNRFYLFSKRQPKDTSSVDSDRDVFNEKPTKEDIVASATETKGAVARLYEQATLHTSIGDINVQLFPQECPKSVENFCVHARNGYYNGHIFHRVIKQFMVQTGDPTGIGTGGESIWGGEFEDELHPRLRHDRPYTLSMANAGPNTNGSQFFFTVCPTPWLDNKHTVFGRVSRGMETVMNISNVKTHPKTDKPYDDITIISINVKNPVRM